jgi:hypothetical protein
VIGKSFFHHVAPCTAVAAFEGRFLEFLALDDLVSESFAYFFPFASTRRRSPRAVKPKDRRFLEPLRRCYRKRQTPLN